jgi:hypothetical protein
MVVPQLLVPTKPVALTIQVDGDADYVPGEIEELAEQAQHLLPPPVHQALSSCDTRLDIMSAAPAAPTVTEREVVVIAQTDLDPVQPEVESVLTALSGLTSGFLVDCVNNRLRMPHGTEWVQL